jgi:hypothetical protein
MSTSRRRSSAYVTRSTGRGNDVPPKTEHAVRDVILMPALAELLQNIVRVAVHSPR